MAPSPSPFGWRAKKYNRRRVGRATGRGLSLPGPFRVLQPLRLRWIEHMISSRPMKKARDHKARLDDANIQLSKELWLVQSGLAVYQVIGLNVKSIESGGAFFGLVQKQSLDAVVLGLAKVFERDETHELCSVRGVYRLAKQVQIQDTNAARAFVGKYGISESGDWIR